MEERMDAVSTSPVKLETAHVVCNSIVEYTEQAGVVVLEKNDCVAFEYTTL